MVKKQVVIQNKTGLHVRPASDFIHLAQQYTSKIHISAAGSTESANAKSILQVLSLALTQGTIMEICADGEDEQAAVDALVALVESGFGE